MKLNHLLSVCVLSLSLGACNEQPKTEAPVVEVETPAPKAEVVKVVVEQPKAETKVVVVEKVKVEVPKEKETEISIGSKGASLKTKKVDIQINE